MEIRVNTRFNLDLIEQTIDIPDLPCELQRRVMKLQDQGVRDALIAMGWTPPTPQSLRSAKKEGGEG